MAKRFLIESFPMSLLIRKVSVILPQNKISTKTLANRKIRLSTYATIAKIEHVKDGAE